MLQLDEIFDKFSQVDGSELFHLDQSLTRQVNVNNW